MVWIECHDAAISRRSAPELFSQEKNLNFASKVANWIIVDVHKYLYQPYVITGKS